MKAYDSQKPDFSDLGYSLSLDDLEGFRYIFTFCHTIYRPTMSRVLQNRFLIARSANPRGARDRHVYQQSLLIKSERLVVQQIISLYMQARR